MNYKRILAIDPSGSFHEGNGTTGWCLYDCINKCLLDNGNIDAEHFKDMEAYWDEHLKLIYDLADADTMVVVEDYILYATKTESQINSRMETPKLIGIIQHYCWLMKIPYYMQLASEVKNRWTNDILMHKGVIYTRNSRHYIDANCKQYINRHCIDAIRHAMHYDTFRNKKEGKSNVRKC